MLTQVLAQVDGRLECRVQLHDRHLPAAARGVPPRLQDPRERHSDCQGEGCFLLVGLQRRGLLACGRRLGTDALQDRVHARVLRRGICAHWRGSAPWRDRVVHSPVEQRRRPWQLGRERPGEHGRHLRCAAGGIRHERTFLPVQVDAHILFHLKSSLASRNGLHSCCCPLAASARLRPLQPNGACAVLLYFLLLIALHYLLLR
mmetsp:Transcript_18535/g.71556  ORF Transcript_18535/g.71556 Transcript_18535/m.71556 type:complete len:203 (-) Transcript_18535:84-692(-)